MTRGVGTFLYRAPEVAQHRAYDSGADMYSLGVVANLREILGRNILLWFTPGCKITGDGTRYPNVLEMSRQRWDRTVRKKEGELTVL